VESSSPLKPSIIRPNPRNFHGLSGCFSMVDQAVPGGPAFVYPRRGRTDDLLWRLVRLQSVIASTHLVILQDSDNGSPDSPNLGRQRAEPKHTT
jgi:hypothetical protein